MTDNTILEALQKFLQKNVATKIKLQKSSDNIKEFELVNPAVHIGWIPPKLPEEWKTEEQIPDIPCLIVGMDDGEDDGQEAGINIRINFVVYHPGQYIPSGKFTPTFNGYQDLLNLCVLTREELAKANIIEGTTSIDRPFRWGMYKDQPYPYWYGYLTFRVPCAVMKYVPTIDEQYE